MSRTAGHSLKTEGDGRMRAYRCACGQWAMTGEEKPIRAAHEQHKAKTGLSSAVSGADAVTPDEAGAGTADGTTGK
jgi:hypothetical protein